jgi:hypothetical protein
MNSDFIFMQNYKVILKELHDYCRSENYMGYNLLDSHNSFIPFKKFGKTISFYVNQFFRRSPLNFRPIVGIKKTINPKAFGLFLYAYTNLKQLDVFEENYLDELNHNFYKWLSENYCKGYSGYCWGYQYDWPQRNGNIVAANTPNVVVTGNIVRALFNYYKIYKIEKSKEIIGSAAMFVLNNLHITRTIHGVCFSYATEERDLVINASLIAAEILTFDDCLNNKVEHLPVVKGVLEYTKNMQNNDGSWYYSHNLKTFEPSKQIDFHQGNVLESLNIILKYYNSFEEEYLPVMLSGLEFYKKKQFDANGTSYYRFPNKWPVDIHNQAEGILLFSRLSSFNSSYLPFAEIIADWTIKKMRSKKGFFYFQKWPLFTNKISYMRWNQAWMMVALSELLISIEK